MTFEGNPYFVGEKLPPLKRTYTFVKQGLKQAMNLTYLVFYIS